MNVFDKNLYWQIVVHKMCKNGEIEKSEIQAFKMDDSDGIAEAIGFHTAMLNKVDYFLEYENNKVLFLELSDLKEDFEKCHKSIENRTQEYLVTSTAKKLTKTQEKLIAKEIWFPIKNEFFKKWSGSIAVIERLYRKTNQLNCEDNPNYNLLVVCKNDTDIRMLDVLKTHLSGTIGKVEICNTQNLRNFT